MSVFDCLLVAHLLGDFLFQTDKMVENKVRSWSWMAYHISVYCLIVGVTMAFFADSVALFVILLALVGVSHSVIDRRYVVRWWMRAVGISVQRLWLAIVLDQVFHLLTLAVVAWVLVAQAS